MQTANEQTLIILFICMTYTIPCTSMATLYIVVSLPCTHSHIQDRGNAQSSCAGLFIGAHLGFDFPGVWIHVDMAAPVYCVSCNIVLSNIQ